MALSDAEIIASARAYWPKLTVAVASDVFLTTWLVWARSQQGVQEWAALYDQGLAHLIAHAAFFMDPNDELGGGAIGGPVLSISTLSMSLSVGSVISDGSDTSTRIMSSTKPGQTWLTLRATLPDRILPIVVELDYGW